MQHKRKEKKESETCLDVLEQVREFSNYAYSVKQEYYGRTLDWAEEYVFALATDISKNIREGQYEVVDEMVQVIETAQAF